MLNIQMINTQATLNAYQVISSQAYIPGETVNLNFQFINPDYSIRYIPGTAATCTVTFQTTDGTELVKSAAMLFNPDDRSIWQVVLSPSDSTVVIGNNFLATLDVTGDGSNVQQAIANNVLSKTLFEGDC